MLQEGRVRFDSKLWHIYQGIHVYLTNYLTEMDKSWCRPLCKDLYIFMIIVFMVVCLNVWLLQINDAYSGLYVLDLKQFME